MSPEEDPYVDAVRRKAARMARARRSRRSVWRTLALAGTLGWQLALPLVAGTLAGSGLSRWLEVPGLALAGILLGLAVGLWQVARSVRAGLEETE